MIVYALEPCTTPAKGSPTFELVEDDIKVGVGLHNEPGRKRTKCKSANILIRTIPEAVLENLPFTGSDEVTPMVNELGGTPIGELCITSSITHDILKEYHIKLFKTYVNNYCTSLDT